MRIYKFLLLSLLFAALGALHAQTLSLVVTGQVTNTAGNPVANHTVYVIGDTTVFPPVFYSGLTNANGAYQITALVPAVPLGSVGAMIVATTDCNGSFLTQTVTYTANAVFGLPANFQLCTSTTPTCSATLTHTAVSANTFTFTATTTASAPVIAWNMGDGNSYYNTLTVTHTYANAGNYVVTLTAIDSLTLCTAAAADTVVATGTSGGPATCYAGFTSIFDSTGTSVTFTNTSYSTSTNSLTYLWTFTSGTTVSTSTQQHPVVNNVNGPLLVCLLMTDSLGGCGANICNYVTQYTCDASFQASTSGQTATFTNTSVYVNPVAPAQSRWSFGDGDTSLLTNPVHTYAAPGTYYVCLFIADSICTSTFCDTITVGTISTTYLLSGQVTTNGSLIGNFPVDHAIVYLIAFDSASMMLTAIDSALISPTDSGFYAFGNLPAGSYAVKAALTTASASYASNLPTYYGGSLFWATATWTTLPSSAAYHNISLIPGVNPGGPGFIGGSVLAGANKQGGAMPNVPVLLLDASMTPVAATYSAADGSFSFSNVAYGDYLVYVDMLNRTTVPVPVTLSAAAASTSNIEIEIGRESITYTTGIENAFDAGMSTIYPNPTAANATLDLSLDQAGEITIEITTAVGQTLTSNTQVLSAGKHTLSLSTEALPAGVYLVRLQTSNGDAAIRRMVKQ